MVLSCAIVRIFKFSNQFFNNAVSSKYRYFQIVYILGVSFITTGELVHKIIVAICQGELVFKIVTPCLE